MDQQVMPSAPNSQVPAPEILRALTHVYRRLRTLAETKSLTTDTEAYFLYSVIPLLHNIMQGDDNPTLSRSIESLRRVTTEYEKAAHDVVAGALAQIDEWAKRIRESDTSSVPGPDNQRVEIVHELQRRATWSEEINVHQENLENTRDTHKEELERITQMLEHATGEQEVHLRQEKARLSSLITATEEAVNRIILEIRTQNDREITELTTYLAALDRVAKGMPRQLVEKPFPPFPSPGVKQKTL